MQVTAPQEEDRLAIDFAEVFREHQLARVQADVARAESPATGAEPLHAARAKGAGPAAQYAILFRRFAKAYWRNPAVNLSRLGAAAVTSFLAGTWYWQLMDNYSDTAALRVRARPARLLSQQCCAQHSAPCACVLCLHRLEPPVLD